MDQNTSNRTGIGVVIGIVILLFAAFVFVLATSARHTAQVPSARPVANPANSGPKPFFDPKEASAPKSAPSPAPRFPPGYNFALNIHGGKVSGGRNSELLIDGNSTDYDGSKGYGMITWTKNPADSFQIELQEPFEIDCVRFLLWDLEENRFYRYKLEVADSSPAKTWTVLADKTGAQDECRSWQVIRFEKRTVKLLRLTGTYNSSNSNFHVVEFQTCIAPPNGFPNDPLPTQPVKPHVQQDDLQF